MSISKYVILGAALAVVGCSAAPSDEEESLEATSEEISAPTCVRTLANGAVPAKHRAMLDTIAFTEGTAGTCGNDGYNTGFAYHCVTSCVSHPNIVWKSGGYSSSAAGRYQFLNTTWKGLGLGNFGPRNQDIGAMKLVSRRGVSLPTDRALNATEFSNALKKISYEWASLPFSPYGQPRKSLSVTRAKYCSFAGCDGSAGGAATAQTGCYSQTLGKNTAENACVQSKFDKEWYQCKNGQWVARSSTATPCSSQHPL